MAASFLKTRLADSLRFTSRNTASKKRKAQDRLRRQAIQSRKSILQQLEDRRLLAVASEPTQPLTSGIDPIAVQLAPVNSDPALDAITLGSGGDLTVALNGTDDTWPTTQTTNLGIGNTHGLAASLLNNDPNADLVVTSDDAIHVLTGAGDGTFAITQTIPGLSAGQFVSPTGNAVPIVTGLLNNDLLPDAVALAPATDSLLVLLGGNNGGTSDSFAAPASLASGGSSPISVAAGDIVGGPAPDLVVGHQDGTVSFLEGDGTGAFTLRTDLTLTAPGPVAGLEINDFDADGNADIAVSHTDGAFVLLGTDDPLPRSPIVNGTFDTGLTGWTAQSVGHPDDGVAGQVNALGGTAQLTENQSFLTSLKQTFVIPPNPQAVTLDIVSLGLENLDGAIPDAFEVSLLDANENSLVATHRAEATSFFNTSKSATHLATGVSFDGTTVTLDISGLAAGTAATLVFDLVGNPPGNSSVAAIDNVTITPDELFSSTFAQVALPGPFGNTGQVTSGDVDGDGNVDLLIVDTSAASALVYNGDGGGGFSAQDPIDLSSFGSDAQGIAVGLLTAGDTVADVVVSLADANRLMTPLNADSTAPTVALTGPSDGSTVTTLPSSLTLQFSEAVQDAGPTGNHSVTNPAAYTVYGFGPNGIDDGGTGDDILVPVQSVTYDPVTFVATVNINGSSLVDDTYKIVVANQSDPNLGIEDLAGNPLLGTSAEGTFTLNTPAVLGAVGSQTIDEGSFASLNLAFSDPGFLGAHTATIDWGDGTITNGIVTEVNGSGSVAGSHRYADNGSFTATVTLTDATGIAVQQTGSVSVGNVDPQILNVTPLTGDEGAAISGSFFDLQDAGFSQGSTVETLTLTVDWGDGTAPEVITPPIDSQSPTGPTTSRPVLTHTYVDDGTYTVRLTVTDDDGGTSNTTTTATIGNRAASVAPIAALAGNEGSTVSLSTTFSDNGLSDTHTATVDWGDGTTTPATVTETAGSGQIDASHIYADDGIYTVTVTVTDNANDFATAVTSSTVAGVAPTATPAPDAEVLVGNPLSIDLASFHDPGFTSASAGTSETFTATIDWGDGSALDVTY